MAQAGSQLKGSCWLRCEGPRGRKETGREALAIIQATESGGLNSRGKRNLESGNILNIEPTRETRENPTKQRGEGFSGVKRNKVVSETWERP